MIKRLLLLGSAAVALGSCARYIPPSDPQFSCETVQSRDRVVLTGTDLKHTAYGFCRRGMKEKTFEYSYDGVAYMRVKYNDNMEIKCSCKNNQGKWFASTEVNCRKAHGLL
ncbi:MAG: hypothetical protein M0P13_11055 [Fibrobacteraceae bacterium]|nr:hypothetical protein [Fibrobacteraceae bacterium]